MSVIAVATADTADLLELSTSGGTISAQQAINHSGGSAYRLNPAAGSSFLGVRGIAADGSSTNLNNATVYAAFWFYLHTSTSAAADLIFMRNSGATGECLIELETNDALRLRYINGANARTTIGSDSSAISKDTWHLVELRIQNSATAAGATVEARLDGVVFATGSSLTVRSVGANVADIIFGTSGGGNTWDYYLDTIVVDDAAYPGPCATLLQLPDGATVTDWASGTGSTFAEVDEVDGSHANDGDTTYIKSTASSDVSRFTLSNPTVPGPIKAIVGWMICRDEGGASSFNIAMKINAFATTAMDPGSSYVYRAIIANTDPSTGVAWDQSGANGNVLRVVNAASVAARITALGTFVIYQVSYPATAASTMPKLSSAATASHSNAATATATSTVPKLTSAAVAREILKATATSTMPKLTSAATAFTSSLLNATAASTMPKLSSAAVATEKLIATATSTLPKLTSAAQAATAYAVGIGASTLPKLTSAAIGRFPFTANAASTLPKLLSAAMASVAPRGTGASTLPKLTSLAAAVFTLPTQFGRRVGTSRFMAHPIGSGRIASIKTGVGRFRRPPPGTAR